MKIQWLIIMLVLIPIVSGMSICKNPTLIKDIPCMMVTTWDYANCTANTAKIYNQDPILISERAFTRFSPATNCNFTWNITTEGDYFWNVTNGDSGKTTVEGEDNMIAIIIGLTVLALFFIGLALANPGHNVGKFTIRLFGYGMALIQVLNIAFMLYANEQGTSLISTLKLNFTLMLILTFMIGMVGLIHLTGRLVNPADESMLDIDESGEKQRRW